ncbi:MAG: DUF3024 domain-containing protein [Coriobacteriia bacterium]|nr:DUF3024 domain-containing protein [Coriobacteriia bacterium]
MAFSEIELALIKNTVGKYCKSISPAHIADQLTFTYDVDGHAVTIWENRPPWDGRGDWTHHGVARFRYNCSRNEWALYWMRADLKWHRYDPAGGIHNLRDLVQVVKEDAHCCFRG